MILIDGQINKYFNISEFACKSNEQILINDQTLTHWQRLIKFRIWYNRSMITNSGYRTKEYNATIPNASQQSQHVLGIANDIALPKEFYGFSKSRQNQFFK